MKHMDEAARAQAAGEGEAAETPAGLDLERLQRELDDDPTLQAILEEVRRGAAAQLLEGQLAANREVLWNMIDLKYQAGAFGPVSDPRSQLRLWTLLAAAEYPHAARMRDSFEEQARRQEQTEQGGEAE